jgi:hypothetical protein
MTCEQCGAPYLEGVTICYSCGAPIGEVEQPTQPVVVPVHLRARVATLAAPPPAPAGAEMETPATEAEPAPPPRDPLWPPRIRPVSVALLAVTLVALAVGVVVLHYRLIPPGVPVDATYRDPGHRFHFALPTLWQATPYAEGVQLADADGVSTAQITVLPPSPGEDAAMRADALAQSLGLGPADAVTVAGEVWQQRSGQVVGPDGVRREIVVLVTLHAGQLYIIEYASPVVSFDATNALVFQPLLRSFAFG